MPTIPTGEFEIESVMESLWNDDLTRKLLNEALNFWPELAENDIQFEEAVHHLLAGLRDAYPNNYLPEQWKLIEEGLGDRLTDYMNGDLT